MVAAFQISRGPRPTVGMPYPQSLGPRGALSKHVRTPSRRKRGAMQGMGLDPVSGTILTGLGTTLINDIFKPPAPAGPTPDQIAALLAQQKAQSDQRTILAIALVGGAALTAITLSR